MDELSNRFKKFKTCIDKDFYLQDDKYILNLSQILKNQDKVFRCKFYKEKTIKCKSYCKINKEDKLRDANLNHVCNVDENMVKKTKILNEAKNVINENKILYNYKPNQIFDISNK